MKPGFLAAVLTVAIGSTSTAFAAFSGYYRVMGQQSGRCLNVTGASTANSASVIVYDYTSGGSTNDEWLVTSIGSGYYRLTARHSGKDMVVASASTATGANIFQYSYGGSSTNDEWQLVDAGGGYYEIKNRNSGKLVQAMGTANVSAVQQHPDANTTNQRFQFVSIGGGGPTPTPAPTATPAPGGLGSIVSSAQWDQIFPPNAPRHAIYTHSGFVAAGSAYPGFCGTGDTAMKRRECAAALANYHHETGGGVYAEEIAQGVYCDSTPTACGYCSGNGLSYFGRGAIQLSWHYNYCAAGQALGMGSSLFTNPGQVSSNSTTMWKTAFWFWNTQTGAGTMTGHNAIVNGAGFGEAIRSINGSIECNGGNPAQVQSRIQQFDRILGILGSTRGAGNVGC